MRQLSSRCAPTVRDTRPYPPTGLTGEDWKLIPPERVCWCDVVTTQKGVWIEPLLSGALRVGSDVFPQVVEYEGTLYLEDGHTRVVRSLLRGVSSGNARVFHHVL